MEKNTDYDCYLFGCESAGIDPLEEWRFRVLQEEILRRANERKQQDSSVPEFVLEQLVSLVAQGYKLAAGSSAEGEDPGAAACGVREPRLPLEPVLAGGATRSFPASNAPDQSFWRI